jgi:hypothetical protein
VKKKLSFLFVVLLMTLPGLAQKPLPKGVSKFFTERGGLDFSRTKVDIFEKVAGSKTDKVEAGGEASDWTELDGRVFARAAWMVEIGEMAPGFGGYELKKGLAAEMQKRLAAEGFRLTPKQFNFSYLRYQKGSTVGTIEVRSFYLGGGNLPLRIEFIFNESYRPVRRRNG